MLTGLSRKVDRSTAGYRIISDATMADALLDRLVHNAYRIELTGTSMRKKTLGKKG